MEHYAPHAGPWRNPQKMFKFAATLKSGAADRAFERAFSRKATLFTAGVVTGLQAGSEIHLLRERKGSHLTPFEATVIFLMLIQITLEITKQ